MSAHIDFESSWEKSAKRDEKRKHREVVLEKAKHEHEKRERRKEEAKLRGEDTWMLSSVSDRITNEEKEIEKSKSRKSKKKKKKKDKKKKKKKDSSSDSDSDSESGPQWVEKSAEEAPVVGVVKGPFRGPILQRDDWMLAPMDLDTLPSVSRAELRAKKQQEDEEKKKQQEILNQAGQHKRELNPYWKSGGAGLPENDPSKKTTPTASKPVVLGDGGVGWLKKALKRCYEQAEEDKKNVEDIAAEKYGSLAKLKSMLREAEEKLEQQKAQIRAERSRDNQPRTDRDQARKRSTSRDRKYQSRRRSRSSDRKNKARSSRSRSKSSDRKYKAKSSRSRSRSNDRKYKTGSRSSDSKHKTRSRSRDRKYQSKDKDDKDKKHRRRSSSSSSSSSDSSSSSSDSSSNNKSRDRKHQTKHRSRSRDRKYQSNERTNSSSNPFKKPRSDSEDDSYNRKSSSSYSKSHSRDSYSNSSSRHSNSRPSSSMFKKQCSDSDDSDHNKRKSSSSYSNSRSSNSRFKKPCSNSDDSDHNKRKSSSSYSNSRSSNSRFKKPCSNSDDSDHNKRGSSTNYSKSSSRDHPHSKSNHDSEPSWKKKGFVKPASDDKDCDTTRDKTERTFIKPGEGSKDYERSRKKGADVSKDEDKRKKSKSSSDSSSSSSSSGSESDNQEELKPEPKAEGPVVLLSEAEMNKLGARILKAEIMGNNDLAAELKAKLEACRKAKTEAPKDLQPGSSSKPDNDEETVVVLTRTDRRGLVRPLGEREHPREPKQGRRKKKQKVETHTGNQGDRTRYFHDDDKHDLKSLVEQERMGTAEDSNMMFARLAGRSLEKTSDDYQLDDVLVDRASMKESESKQEDRDRFMSIMEHKKMSKAMESCQFCFDKVPKHLIIAIGIKCYLCLPSHKSLTEGHCLIVPMQHVTQGTVVDEDVWDEIKIFRKGLTKMFEEEGEDCVFMEMSRNLNYHPHMFIDCVPMAKEVGDMAPIYFKKAIQESESEWSQNKKLVDLSQKDIRRSVPKGFPYFSVDFGLQGGFAHVIEDEKEFAPYFGREVVGGMLDVGPEHWRKPRKENFEDQRKKVLQFSEMWKPYDWTQRLVTGDS